MFSSAHLTNELKNIYESLAKNRQHVFKTNSKEKSSSKSAELRRTGNNWYGARKDARALVEYTKSVAAAPKGSVELALAYANRSAVLFTLHRYVSCLLDINRALNGKYPEHLMKKLLDRKQDCLMKIKAENELKLKGLEIVRDTRAYQSSFLTYHERFMFTPSEVDGDETDLVEPDHLSILGWTKKLTNPLLPNTSSKVKLAFDDKWGRHFVATDNLEPGEIISIEEFFATIIYEQKEPTVSNCCHCLKWCDALIPCESCTAEMYCSERCRIKAYNSYHRTECTLFSYSFYTQMSRNQKLSLRTFLTGTHQGDPLRLKKLLEDRRLAEIFLDTTTFVNEQFETDYVSILKLCKRFEYEGERLDDLLMDCASIMLILKDNSYFETISEEDKVKNFETLSNDEMFAGLLLLSHLSSVRYNAFGITEEKVGKSNEFRGDAHLMAAGLCCLLSFFNHSCTANSGNVVRERNQIMYAIRPIKAGEQILYPYGFRYGDLPLSERAERLMKVHGLICECEACTNDWPLFNKIDYHKMNYKTTKRSKIRLIRMIHEQLMKRCSAFHQNSKYFGDQAVLYDWCKKLHKYVKEPSQTIVACESFIILAMKEKGNVRLDVSFEDFYESVPLGVCDGAPMSSLFSRN